MSKTLEDIVAMTQAGHAANEAFTRAMYDRIRETREDIERLLEDYRQRGGTFDWHHNDARKFSFEIKRAPHQDGPLLSLEVTCEADQDKCRFKVKAGAESASLKLDQFTPARVREMIFAALASKIAAKFNMETDA